MKRFLTYILISTLLIFSANTAFAKDIKFIQITDSHFSMKSEYTNNVLRETVKQINKEKNVSFVIFTGDNIDRPNADDLGAFVRIANKLNTPYYLVIGNHEVYKNGGMSKKDYIKVVKNNNWMYKPSKPNYVIKKNGFVFIVVDGAKEVIPGPAGYYKDTTLAWLDKQLYKYKKNPVVIFQHYPLVEPRKQKSHSTYQPEKYFEVLKKHDNVIAILSGHYHVNGEKMQDGIYHISTPSLLIKPNYYKVVDIVTTPKFSPMIYTELKSVDVKD